jgi:hypothetical protein
VKGAINTVSSIHVSNSCGSTGTCLFSRGSRPAAIPRQKCNLTNWSSSGLANPAPIIQTFYLEEHLAHHLRLDGVVTLVDAKHATQHIEEVKPDGVVNEAVEQIAYADRIILNKVSYFEWVLGPMSFSYLELTTARTMVRN